MQLPVQVFQTNDGRDVPIAVRVNHKARRLILRVDQKKQLGIAVAPSEAYVADALNFARSRLDWIADRLAQMPEPMTLTEGAEIPLRGEIHELSGVGTGRLARIEPGDPPRIVCPGDPSTLGARAERFLRKQAKADLSYAVERHAETLDVRPNRISVKDTRTRWGSCSSKGVLSFSWRLVCAPPFVLDYVAAHEVAHLREMNHSPRFWAEVEKCIPNWKPARNWLHSEGRHLHAINADAL